MFDIQGAHRECGPNFSKSSASSGVDADILLTLIQELSDEEIRELEDELDFFAFTGLRSPRIQAILDGADASSRADAEDFDRAPRPISLPMAF